MEACAGEMKENNFFSAFEAGKFLKAKGRRMTFGIAPNSLLKKQGLHGFGAIGLLVYENATDSCQSTTRR